MIKWRFDQPGSVTYVATETQFSQNVSHSWNHGLGKIVSALLAEGMRLTMLEEHDSVPWKALSQGLVGDEHGEYRLVDHRERLPMTYTLQAVKDR